MSFLEQFLAHLLSALVIAVMLAVCLRSRAGGVGVTGRRVYRTHPAWFVFCGAGGLFLVVLFAYASQTALPADRPIAAGCSAGAALFFLFLAATLRAASVALDETTVTSRTLFGERSVELANIERVAVKGLAVELLLRKEPGTSRRPRPLLFMIAFRGLGELLATLRARAGQG